MKTLTQNLHSSIYKVRRVIIVILLSLSFSLAFAKKTEWMYGAETKLNFANQIAANPLNMEYGNYNWQKLTCFGASAFLEMQKSKHWSFAGRLGYIQKGFVQPNQTQFQVINGNKNEAPVTATTSNKNLFHYSNLDLLAKYNFGNKLLVPFIDAGLRINYLLAKNIGSANLFELSGNQYYNYKFYKRAALGIIAGAGITFDKKITLAFETDLDITKSVNTSNLTVKNWVNSISLAFNINQLFQLY